jgi:hypothetical protein
MIVFFKPSDFAICNACIAWAGLAFALPINDFLPVMTLPPSVPALIAENSVFTLMKPSAIAGSGVSNTVTEPYLVFVPVFSRGFLHPFQSNM